MTLTFQLADGDTARVEVVHLLNGGWAGRRQEDVRGHIEELAKLGVPGPTVTPTLLPVSHYLAQQTDMVQVPHDRTSGEVEWAIVVTDEKEVLLTLACDHTDRNLEVHGIAWSKNAAPDVLSSAAWRLSEVEDHIDALKLTAWVRHGEDEQVIQSGTFADLLPPSYWLEVLRERGLLEPGTVLLSGTVNMNGGVDQFADAWRAELADPVLGRSLTLAYDLVQMAEPIE